MRRDAKFSKVSVVGIATALTLSACGAEGAGSGVAAGGDQTQDAGAGGDQGQSETREVDLALSTGSPFGYGYWIADSLGFYDEEGLDVTLQPTGGSSDVAQLLAGKQVPAGMGVPGAMLPAMERGADLHPFFTYAYGEVFDIVVPEGSSASSIADLKGQTIGISALSGGEVPLLRALLKEEGIDPDADVELIAVGEGTPNIKLAFDQNKISAYAGAKSVIAEFPAANITVESVAPEELSDLPAEGLLANSDSVSDRELLVGLGRGTAKGQLIAYSNVDAAVCVLKEAMPQEFTDVEAGRAALEGTLAITTAPKNDDGTYEFGKLTAEGWQTYVDIYQEAGILTEDVPVEELVVTDLLDEINDFDQQAIIDQAAELPTDC